MPAPDGGTDVINALPCIPWKPVAVIAAVLTGVAGGLGFHAFDYGEGLSYFSKDPQACAVGRASRE